MNLESELLNSRKQLSILMYLGGILGLVFGGIHLSTFLTSGSSIALSDAVFNAGLGLVELIGGWLTSKGKLLAFLPAVTILLASLVYSYMVGRGFNITSLVLGGLFLGWMTILWRRGGLS